MEIIIYIIYYKKIIVDNIIYNEKYNIMLLK